MRCKICGCNVGDAAEYCPDCGKTIRRPAGEFSAPPSGAPYPASRPAVQAFQAPPPEYQATPPAGEYREAPPRRERPAQPPREERPHARKEKKRSRAPFGANTFFSLLAALLLLVCSFGTVCCDMLRLRYESQPESVYTGISYSMGYRSLIDDGFSDFFENEDRLTNFSIVAVSILLIAAIACAAVAAAFALRRKSSAAAKVVGIGFIAPLVSYIIGFINAMSIRSSYLDDGFPEDKCHLSAVPLAMIAVCAAAACVSFLASRALEEESG